MKRIKHNDLTHYFMLPHHTLPASYLASCEEFFTWLKDRRKNGFKAPSTKQSCNPDGWPSGKRQASSNKRLTAQGPSDINRIIKEKYYENK